jgi:DNA-binding transcriptional ArsR family regulator
LSSDHEKLWSTLPAKLSHPVRAPIVEALWWIDEPLSAREAVDALDSDFTMWEVAHHLRVLEELGVVEVLAADPGRAASRRDGFDVLYRLKARRSDVSR